MTFAIAAGAQATAIGAQTRTGEAAEVPLMPRDDSALRTELRQQQDLTLLLRQRLASAEQASAMLPWVLACLAVVSVLALWLGVRVWRGLPAKASPDRHRHAAQGQEDAEDSVGPATVFAPGLIGLMRQESSVEVDQVSTKGMAANPMADPGSMVLGGAGTLAVAMAPAGLAPAMASRALPPSPTAKPAAPSRGPGAAVPAGDGAAGSGGGEPPLRAAEVTMAVHTPRAVSVEELFDLEQQVDFFLVLGQTESAVDMLVSHIRGTGGNSALPYLKLMEVYRQQGDSESHERTRKRFNQRFNAHAPDWTANPAQGRALDEYPEVLDRLVRAWPMPLDALAELEAMLFRRSRGELFDLPAFRDVLLLHAMAIDLHERSPMSASRVDILLPLGEELSDNTAPLPHMVASTPADTPRHLLASWAGLGNGPVDLGDAAAAPEPAPFSRQRANRPAAGADSFSLDLDLSDFAPAPKEYTHPAAFTDLAMRADFSPLPLAAANDQPRSGPAAPAAPKA